MNVCCFNRYYGNAITEFMALSDNIYDYVIVHLWPTVYMYFYTAHYMWA
jgi:hypothetical protein